MFLLWILAAGVGIYALTRSQTPVTGTDKQLGSGMGAGGSGLPATQEMTHDQKVALAKTLVLRWVYGEKEMVDYNTLEVGAPGVNSYPDAASALTTILGANMTDGHAILANGVANPTRILVPHYPGGELKYAATSASTPFAIFLRPLEGKAIFAEAGATFGPDQFNPAPGTIVKKDAPGEVKMMSPLSAKRVLALPAGPTAAKTGTLDLTGASGFGTPGDISTIHAQDLPDGDPLTTIYDDGARITVYPLKVAREAYLDYTRGNTGSKLATTIAGAAKKTFELGYRQAAADLTTAALALGWRF